MISPLGYLDYRNWLRDLYKERRRSDAFFSYRYMALRLGISHSFLVRVLQGRKHLSEESVDRFVEFLKLQGTEEEYFRVLVRFGRTPSEQERRTCLERLLALQGMRLASLDLSAVDYFKGWLPPALRSLAVLMPKATPARLAQAFHPPVTEQQIAEALDLLQRLGLLRRSADGREWIQSDAYVEPGPGIAKIVVRNHQREILSLAGEAIERHAPEERHIATATLSLDPADLEEARARLRALRDSLFQLSAEAREPGVVMNLALALYPVAGKRPARRPTTSREAKP